MNKPPLIALFGKRRTGKDTIGEVVQTVLSEMVSRDRQHLVMVPLHRFDAPLSFLPVTDDDRLADLKTYMTARDDGYFVKLFKTRTDLNDGSIILDGQRAIEYAWCKTRGYLMVYLMCGDEERMRRGVHQDDLKAPSEIALDVLGIDAWDVVLQTDMQSIDECASDILDALQGPDSANPVPDRQESMNYEQRTGAPEVSIVWSIRHSGWH